MAGGGEHIPQAAAAVVGTGAAPALPGSYLLLFATARPQTIVVGRLGPLVVAAGWYCYAGSAFGAGGLAGRIGHHTRPVARPHWHVDYLRSAVELQGVWWTTAPARLEHAWAATMAALPGATISLRRFGASDCRCPAHLVYLPELPPAAAITELLQGPFPGDGLTDS